MKLRACCVSPHAPCIATSVNGAHRRARSIAAFTMVEIAICLAIIGFALVAIIGVLPSGMRVQKDNREETVINQDAAYWMEAIRSGAKGLDLLTNYVDYIVVSSAIVDPGRAVGAVSTTVYANPQAAPSILAPVGTGAAIPLGSGSQIIGLLSTPRYEPLNIGNYRSNYVFTSDAGSYSYAYGVSWTTSGAKYRSNYVAAYVRAISGPATDKGNNVSSRDFAFHYRLVPEVIPAGWTALQNFDWNLQGLGPLQRQSLTNQWKVLQTTAANLHEVRLLFRWPVLSGRDPLDSNSPRIGGGRQIFRSLASGSLDAFVRAQRETNYFFNPTVFWSID